MVDGGEWKVGNGMNRLDKYMIFIAIFSKLFLVLQIINIVVNQDSENVSFSAYLVYFISSASWVLYALYYGETVVLTSSSLGFVLGLLAMCIVVVFKPDKKDVL